MHSKYLMACNHPTNGKHLLYLTLAIPWNKKFNQSVTEWPISNQSSGTENPTPCYIVTKPQERRLPPIERNNSMVSLPACFQNQPTIEPIDTGSSIVLSLSINYS